MRLKIDIETDDDIALSDPESIVRDAIAALFRYAAHVPESDSRDIRDDNGNKVGTIYIEREG